MTNANLEVLVSSLSDLKALQIVSLTKKLSGSTEGEEAPLSASESTAVTDFCEKLNQLTILHRVELSKMLENAWGVSAAAPVVMAGAAVAAEEVEEKTEFDVVLVSAGSSKLNVIKEVRAITGWGLKEAKDAADGSKIVLKAGISKDEAAEIKKKLEAAGATVELA